MEAYIQLDNFIENYKYLPDQGSQAWLEQRKNIVGGSEISNLFGRGFNSGKSGIEKLLQSKLGYDQFKSNIYTRWGTVFEESARLCAEQILYSDIRETGSCPVDEYHSFSPDGLATINKNNIPPHPSNNIVYDIRRSVIDNPEIPDIFNALFEFKCPARRVIKYGRAIPRYYHDQINTGVSVLPVSCGFYMEFKIIPWTHTRVPADTDIAFGAIGASLGDKNKMRTRIGSCELPDKTHDIFEDIVNDSRVADVYYTIPYLVHDLQRHNSPDYMLSPADHDLIADIKTGFYNEIINMRYRPDQDLWIYPFIISDINFVYVKKSREFYTGDVLPRLREFKSVLEQCRREINNCDVQPENNFKSGSFEHLLQYKKNKTADYATDIIKKYASEYMSRFA